MDKIKDLLLDLEKKVEANMKELSRLREENDVLLEKNKTLKREKNNQNSRCNS